MIAIHADIFSRKRQKLRQFIQDMSFHETGDSYEKGSDSPFFYPLFHHLSGCNYGVFFFYTCPGMVLFPHYLAGLYLRAISIRYALSPSSNNFHFFADSFLK